MLILVRLGRWEFSIQRGDREEPQQPEYATDHPPPLEVWTPDTVGFIHPDDREA